MEKSKSKQVLKIIIPVVILILVLGISYALWLITRTQENDNVVDTLKCLNITLTDETSAINLTNEYAISNAKGMAKEPYTFTVTNTCNTPALITVALEVLNTTTIAHKHVRASLNNSGDTTDNSNILTGYSTASATINGATSYIINKDVRIKGNQSKTYDLRVWIDEATTADEGMNKTFRSKIVLIGAPAGPYCNTANMTLLADNILCNDITPEAIEAKGDPNFAAIATSADTGLYAAEDEYGTSYYYRGEKDLLNNNLIFAGFQWKIVRINGDGSIRIIYNGTCPGNECAINSTGTATQIAGVHEWSAMPYYNDNKYVGYMYGGANGSSSTSKVTDMTSGNYTLSTNAVYNETSSNAKVQLDSWYASNIANQGASIISKIADNIFCNDREIGDSASHNIFGIPTVGTGFGASETVYKSLERMISDDLLLYLGVAPIGKEKATPTLKCAVQNDRFTVNETTLGNGALTYPVGLVSMDEVVMGGLTMPEEANPTNYLYTNQSYWTFSPNTFYSGSAHVWVVNSTGSLDGYNVGIHSYGLRPIISLDSETTITGEGSISNPYKVLSD